MLLSTMNNKCLILLMFFFLHNFALSSTKIKIYKIIRCNDQTYYPVTVKDVSLEIENGYVHVSGSLTTEANIDGPVQATLLVKRYINYIKIWTPIPCIESIGSCTYEDLCHWGKPQNETCPERFLKNNVPCRCPISEGTYTMDPDYKIPLFKIPQRKIISIGYENVPISTPETGTYYVRALITTTGKKLMSCYEFYLDYDDNSWLNQFESEYSVNMI